MAEKTMKTTAEKVAEIISDAGGSLVGRTKLQKLAYLLAVASGERHFHFTYHHYGPYSEDLALATTQARAQGLISETEHRTDWGGTYSIYTLCRGQISTDRNVKQKELIRAAAEANTVVLELAATAAYLKAQGAQDPWAETRDRKPAKAEEGRLENAQTLYAQLRALAPELPEIKP